MGLFISIMITVNQFLYACENFSLGLRELGCHKYISRCEPVLKCIWCIIFMIIYIFIAKISPQTNFSLVNCEIKLSQIKVGLQYL